MNNLVFRLKQDYEEDNQQDNLSIREQYENSYCYGGDSSEGDCFTDGEDSPTDNYEPIFGDNYDEDVGIIVGIVIGCLIAVAGISVGIYYALV